MAANNPVPGTVVPVGSAVNPGGSQGVQGIQGPQGPQGVPTGVGFMAKTAAYTITSADSGKYILCSGGSWTLTLPPAAASLYFQVKNDMGISGVTGTITILPVGGATVNGQGSIPLLAQQDCTIITDGTNWRTLGLQRNLVLGTLDITSAVANASVLLPVGYRLFELDWTGLQTSNATNVALWGLFSTDGGNTWLNSSFYYNFMYTNAATTVAAGNSNSATYAYLGWPIGATPRAKVRMSFSPGIGSSYPNYLSESGNFYDAGQYVGRMSIEGFYNSASAVINALQFYGSTGNIVAASLTVRGIV
jgi:hypothetical protein